MRLVCPNCDAQYEVDDAAIPDDGRDVQCSNCGHAWFQLPAHMADAEADEADAALFQSPVAAAEGVAPPAVMAAQTSAAEAAAPVADEDDPPAAAQPPRRTLDESVLAVLREEAERETAARRAEAARTVEVQPDLGLAPPASTPRAVPQQTAPEPEPQAPAAQTDQMTQPPGTTRPGARRDLLPDIEEINSTLRAGSETREPPAEAAEVAAAARSGGFRAGFAAVIVLAVVMVAMYVLAPRISQHLPGSAATMERYVAAVDGARLWLDSTMQGAVTRLRGLSGQDG